MKLAVIGSGALRTLGVLHDVLRLPTMKGAQVHLMDLDATRVDTVGRLAQQMPEALEAGAEITWGTELAPALEGADYVYVVIRVGGVESMTRDEEISCELGFHGHDDFGPPAVFISLRTIPVLLDICRQIAQICPDAWVIDFTNPVPHLVRAIEHYTDLKVVGLCGGDRNMVWDLGGIMGWPGEEIVKVDYDAVGIDHFGWGLRMEYEGQDFYPLLEQRIAEIGDLEELPYYLRWMIQVYQVYGYGIFSSAHCYHWFYHDEMTRNRVEHMRQVREKGTSRAQTQDQDHVEARALLEAGLEGKFWEHELLDQLRENPLQEAIGARLLRGLTGVEPVKMVVARINEEGVTNLPPEAITEYSVTVEKDSICPAVHDPVPQPAAGLTQAILEHQRLVVEAAVTGDPRLLRQAMYADPVMRDHDRMEELLARLLEANRGQIPDSLQDQSPNF